MTAVRTCSACVAMVVVQLAYSGANILVKIALEEGLNQIVFVVYRHLIAMLILGPFAYVLERKQRPPVSFVVVMKIFMLSLLGTTVHLNVYYAGLAYTSPIVGSALSNVVPGLTFVMSLLFGVEKVKIKTARGNAKVLGTLACIAGSLVFTFWKGGILSKGIVRSPLLHIHGNAQSSHHVSDHQYYGEQNWMNGAFLILIIEVAWSAWLILQVNTYY